MTIASILRRLVRVIDFSENLMVNITSEIGLVIQTKIDEIYTYLLYNRWRNFSCLSWIALEIILWWNRGYFFLNLIVTLMAAWHAISEKH